MQYFARVNSYNIVSEVVIINDEDCNDYLGNFSEIIGAEFCAKTFGVIPGERWIRAAKDGSIRRQYPGPGYKYDEEKDRFVPPSPHGAWIFDEILYEWQPPHPQPDLTEEERNLGYNYRWDDNEYLLNNENGWVLEQVGE